MSTDSQNHSTMKLAQFFCLFCHLSLFHFYYSLITPPVLSLVSYLGLRTSNCFLKILSWSNLQTSQFLQFVITHLCNGLDENGQDHLSELDKARYLDLETCSPRIKESLKRVKCLLRLLMLNEIDVQYSTTIHQIFYSASTRHRSQIFCIRPDDESRVGTPLRQNLNWCHLLFLIFLLFISVFIYSFKYWPPYCNPSNCS